MSKIDITAEYIREQLAYNPDTGLFHWKQRRIGRQQGRPAGSFNRVHGYVVIGLDGRQFFGHRLAWLYVHGEWPREIDHRDRDRANNRIANLREVPHQWNAQNKTVSTTTGVRQVKGRFSARIKVNGQEISLGAFATAEDASAAYMEAKTRHHDGMICSTGATE